MNVREGSITSLYSGTTYLRTHLVDCNGNYIGIGIDIDV